MHHPYDQVDDITRQFRGPPGERLDSREPTRIGADGAIARLRQCRYTAQRQVGDRAEKIDVAPNTVVLDLSDAFEGCIIDGSGLSRPTQSLARRRVAAGKTEVHELRLPAERDEHVGGLDVAVGHPEAMGVFQPLYQLVNDAQCPRQVDGPADPHQFPQCLSLDELHRDVAGVVFPADVLDGDDVGMSKQTSHFPLALERLAFFGIGTVTTAQHLHGENAATVSVDGAIHPREGSSPHLVEDLGPAVEEAIDLATQEPIELIARQPFMADERRAELLHRHVAAAEFAPDRIEVRRLHEIQLLQAVGEFISRQRLHDRQKPGGIRNARLERRGRQAGRAGRTG